MFCQRWSSPTVGLHSTSVTEALPYSGTSRRTSSFLLYVMCCVFWSPWDQELWVSLKWWCKNKAKTSRKKVGGDFEQRFVVLCAVCCCVSVCQFTFGNSVSNKHNKKIGWTEIGIVEKLDEHKPASEVSERDKSVRLGYIERESVCVRGGERASELERERVRESM